MQNYDYLYHHGTKGMKWKVHKTDNTSVKEVSDKKLKKTKDSQNQKDKSNKTKKDSSKIVNDVIDGKFGNGETRVKALKKAGYDYDKIQNLVNEKLLGKTVAKRIAARRKKGK